MTSRWKTKAAVALLGCGLSLLIGEGVVRAAVPQPPSWLAIYRRHPALPFYAHIPDVQTLIDTGESRWTICTDAQGFRIGCRPKPRDDRPCVLWLGDSFAFGQGVSFEESFIGILESDPNSKVHFLNAAVNGYGPAQYRETLEFSLASGIRPRSVLVETFLGNDFIDCIWSKDLPIRDGILGNEGGLKSYLKLRSHLYRFVAAAFHRWRAPQPTQTVVDYEMAEPRNWIEGQYRQAEQIYRKEFARLAELCAEHGIPMGVLIIPRSTMIEGLQKGISKGMEDASGQTLAWKHARAIFEDLGIRVLDLTPVLLQQTLDEVYFPIDGHFTPRGNRIAAEEIRRNWDSLIDAR